MPADSEEGIATKPSRLDSALREESQVSIAAKERSVLLTNHTSYRGVHKGSQVEHSSVGQVVASSKVPPESFWLDWSWTRSHI